MQKVKEELLNIVDDNGAPTGKSVSRVKAHAEGIRHGASHIFIYRMQDGRLEILLQRRSVKKDSFPGCLDISSAGHMEAGMGYLQTAKKELSEELGICAEDKELEECFSLHYRAEDEFYGKQFINNEYNRVYILEKDVQESDLTLQEEEVSEVCWMDADDILERLRQNDPDFCLDKAEYQRALACIRAKLLCQNHALSVRDRIEIKDTGELLELLNKFDDTAYTATYCGRNSTAERLFPGMYLMAGGFRRDRETFRDAFGFAEDMEITFYETTVYTYDQTEKNICLNIFPSISDNFCRTRQYADTVPALKQYLQKLHQDLDAPIPILSADDNFELKGRLTLGIWITVYEEDTTKRQWLTIEAI